MWLVLFLMAINCCQHVLTPKYRIPIAFLLGAGGVEGLETPRLWQASGLSERQRAEILGCKADGWDNNGLISTFWDDNIYIYNPQQSGF